MKIVTLELEGRVISKKNARRVFYSGKRIVNVPSKAFEAFKVEALLQIQSRAKNQKTLPPPYHLEYIFRMKGKLNSDLDNMIASINDILQDAEIITDDKYIHSLQATKYAGAKDFFTTVKIISLSDSNGTKKRGDLPKNPVRNVKSVKI